MTHRDQITQHFKSYNVAITRFFDLQFMSNTVSLPADILVVALCNLEDVELMQQIAQGNYTEFDLYDSVYFNDDYDQMMEELLPQID